MSADPQPISRQSSQEWKVLSRSSSASSLEEFEIVDSTPAPEVDLVAEADPMSTSQTSQVEESIRFFEGMKKTRGCNQGCNTGSQVAEADPLDIEEDVEEEVNSGSDAESEFEEIVPQDEIAEESPPSAFQVVDTVESRHSSPSFTCQFFELDDVELDSCDGASVQLDEPEELPAATAPAESSTRAHRRRRGLAPAKVTQLADKIRQNASDGLSEAVRLINALDERIDDACPHVRHGAIYCKEQVQTDFQSTAEVMRDAFGEGQESEQHTATTFSHVEDQFKNDFTNIRKDVDAALGCLLGSSGRPSEQDRRQKTLKTAVPATTCSLVSLAVASWLVPVRLARFAATNLAM